MPPWLDQLLIEEDEDQVELLETLLSLANEIAEPLEAASYVLARSLIGST